MLLFAFSLLVAPFEFEFEFASASLEDEHASIAEAGDGGGGGGAGAGAGVGEGAEAAAPLVPAECRSTTSVERTFGLYAGVEDFELEDEEVEVGVDEAALTATVTAERVLPKTGPPVGAEARERREEKKDVRFACGPLDRAAGCA